jgi:bifunctional pyridoxal-dependent enzyme with beta-cystathionase and maltose regulon repressor activities
VVRAPAGRDRRDGRRAGLRARGTDRGKVGFATAGYPPFLQQLPPAGFTIRQIPLRADGSFDLDQLTLELRDGLRVLILASPHNPTGRVDLGLEGWLDCAGLDLAPDPVAFFLAQAKVALGTGLDYDPAGRERVRLNFGTGPELLAEILDRMTRALTS